jgi:hypothetical protein
VAGRFLRRVLPVRIGTQGENVRQRIPVGEKIRLLPHCAQQIQRHHGAGDDQARQQSLRLLDRGRSGRGLPAPHAGFDERGRGRRQLRVARQVQAQRVLCEPVLRVIEGEEGALLLAPVRRPCCLELLCYQESLFSRVLMATGPHPRCEELSRSVVDAATIVAKGSKANGE